jgi:hypothetical protein
VVLSRWPAPGRCKRRLAALLGGGGAARIQARLSDHALAAAREAAARLGAEAGAAPELVLAVSGLGRGAARRWGEELGADRVVPQGPGSLGVRLQRQVRQARRAGVSRLVMIGSDLPRLNAGDLMAAFAALERVPLVLGPAVDGGYWLIGLRASVPVLFAGAAAPIAWGSDRVLEQTLKAAWQAGLTLELLAEQGDLDRPADLDRWR